MTAPPAGALEACLALLEKATPGEWRWSPNGNIVPAHYTDDCEIAAVYFEHMDDVGVPDNAAAIITAVNLLKDHGPALLAALRLRERAERLEAALRLYMAAGVANSTDFRTQAQARDAARAALADGDSASA